MNSMNPLFNPEYWDCKCDDNYIHKKPRNYCPSCGASENNSSDSWSHEVETLYNAMGDKALLLGRNILKRIHVKRANEG
jgi:hypothetical protein